MPIKRPMGWFRPIAFLLTSVARTHGAAVASATSSAGGSLLQRLVLRPSQVSRGYTVKVIQGGRSVQGQVTLDMCGYHFASENLRTGRLQTAYVRHGSDLSLSNEVVRYQSRGADYAMREIVQAVRTCPRRPVPSAVRGVPPLTYRLTLLPTAGKRLLSSAIAMRATVTGTLKGKRMTETSFVVYQRSRDVLSGIYVFGGSLKARRAMAFAASAQSARNLRQHP